VRDNPLAKPEETPTTTEGLATALKRLEKQLEMLDNRLDNVDSVVTAVAERVMKQPITMNITCSKCGHKIEIAILGTEKPTR
jgi:formylmethanofuran dehydrogenase subunit E